MIIGLHGVQSVRLDFSQRHSVFIADNGAGKTTALFTLQCILTDNWRKILRYDFASIVIQFSGGEVFSVSKSEIANYGSGGWFQRLLERGHLSEAELRELAHKARHTSLEAIRSEPLFRRLWQSSHMPAPRTYDMLLRTATYDDEASLFSDSTSGDLNRLRQFIRNAYPHSVIYLPTYRRVEQELRMLLDKEEAEDSFGGTIRFGMKDVERRIDAIGSKIRDHFVITYGRISGQMLNQLSRTGPLSPATLSRLANRGDVEIVLTRLSDYVSEEDRHHILSLYDSGALFDNQYLTSFLSSLIASYEDVRHLEASLESFGRKCNQYLIRKEFRYEAAAASLTLHEKGSRGNALDLNTLSSGEKQIVGVLSQVYLGEKDSYVVIFDEPELSLSVEWQRNILPDIIHAPKCFSLIAATHSPFIFENELDFCTRSLVTMEYVQAQLGVEGDDG